MNARWPTLLIILMALLGAVSAKKDKENKRMKMKKGTRNRRNDNNAINNNKDNNNKNQRVRQKDRNSVCWPYRSINRPAFGLCKAYCERIRCQAKSQPTNRCLALQKKFLRQTNQGSFPCDSTLTVMSDVPSSVPTILLPDAIPSLAVPSMLPSMAPSPVDA
jgi:hypothetical protein